MDTENKDNPEDGLEPEIEIEIQDDAPVVEGADKAKTEEPPAKSAQEGIEALQRQLEAERQARAQIEQQARQTEQEAARYRTQAERSYSDNLANAVDLATQELEKQGNIWEAAMAAGDFGKAKEAQAAQALAAAALDRANSMRATYEARQKQQERPAPQPQRTYTPQTQAWIDRNPQFLSDPAFQRRATAADDIARTEGLVVDTPAYFARIDEIMGLSRREVKQEPAPRRDEVAPAAPVRSAPKGTEAGRIKYTLSAAEKEIADMTGISYAQYAKNRDAIARGA